MQEKTILIVEDNAVNRKLLLTILRPHGYRLLTAMDGEEAVHLAMTESPDLIIMDLQLPKLNGYQATRIIKESPSTANIPIVALTAHAMIQQQEQAMQAGFNGYITKPIDTRAFPETIRGYLSRGTC